ncbi:hypothetical protein [Shinella sp.]|nr:hypothetical protein [Shinella sp.]
MLRVDKVEPVSSAKLSEVLEPAAVASERVARVAAICAEFEQHQSLNAT